MIITALVLFIAGIALIANGLSMRKRRLKLGSTWGFRTRETMESSATWQSSHIAGGWTVMMAGLGAEIAGAVLLLFPATSLTVQSVVIVCAVAWMVLLYFAAKGQVSETAARINRN